MASLAIMILLPGSLFLPAKPVSAGVAAWSAETIPSTLNNVLGPAGAGENLDVCDFAIADDGTTIYAVPGNSISEKVLYKSIDAGISWTAFSVDIKADLVAVAPDNRNMVAIASSTTPEVYLTLDGGTNWDTLGTPQGGTTIADAIYDIAISAARQSVHYIAAAGKEASNAANVWYFGSGLVVPSWQDTRTLPGYESGNEVTAVEFSPSFSLDAAMLAISGNYSVGIHLQIMDVIAKKWNDSASYFNYPCTVVANSGITGLSSASLALDPNYDATDDDTRKVFIGLTVEGNASARATSGIYRFVDTTEKQLQTNINIHSVAFSGYYLVAGSYDSTTVYRSTNPSSTSPTVLTSTTTKGPGGDNKVIVDWLGSNVMAGTSGDESAFAVSIDKGKTFNDISLIDTAITYARDVAVSSNAGKVYFVTDDGSDLSLWCKTTRWQRVFSKQDAIDFIVRIAPDNANYVYLARKDTTTVYFNSNAGNSQWFSRDCDISIQDLAVESQSVAYALNNVGSVVKTTNTGTTWGSVVVSTLNRGATIVSVSTDIIMVGSQDGYVAYSTDGNVSWTKIAQIIENGADNVQIVADQYYSSNHIIYAASDTPGQNIKKWQIGTSTEWTDIFKDTLSGGVYGLVIDNNTLYALEYPSSGQSTLWLYISPTNATDISTSWSYSSTNYITDIDDGTVHLDATPRALKASSAKLWAVKTNGTNKLYSFSDTAIDINLRTPASGLTVHVNTSTGIAKDTSFSWNRPLETTEYELEIALDEDFYISVAKIIVPSINPVASVIVGPGQSGDNMVNFMPGATYYWRIRTTQPIYSKYSVSEYFFVEPAIATVPDVLTPANGSSNTGRKPSFSWAPVSGTTEYQFMLSDNYTMNQPLIDVITGTTGFTLTQELEYGTTYFWRVRAINPVATDWSQLANFTVQKEPSEPVPEVTVKPLPPTVIELPAPSQTPTITLAPPQKPTAQVVPDTLRTAIIILSILLFIVIILIIASLPARLFPAPSTLAGPFRGTSRRARRIGNQVGRLWEDVANRARDLTPFKTQPPPAGKARDINTITFAVRSFLLMTASAEKENGQPHLSAEEERKIGKKLASGIRDLAVEKPIYLNYPEDAAIFLQIWARYGSRDETNRYLKKSFKSNPENALALLKCYLTAPERPETDSAEKREFTRAHYDALTQVVDPDSVYEAVSKLLKFRFEKAEEQALGDLIDRTIAYQFVRIHYDIKK